jgi:hypothetical protein
MNVNYFKVYGKNIKIRINELEKLKESFEAKQNHFNLIEMDNQTLRQYF